MKGKVKNFDPLKGYGFITGEDGKDYFVHKSALKEGVNLAPGADVTFDGVQGDRGPKAENVAIGTAEEPAAEAAPAAEPAAEEAAPAEEAPAEETKEEAASEAEPASEAPAEEEKKEGQ